MKSVRNERSAAAIGRMLEDMGPLARRKIEVAIEKSAAELVSTMKALAPVDTGALRDSIRSERIDPLTIDVKAGNDEVYYAGMVEYGTQAGTFRGRTAHGRLIYRTHPGTAARPFFMPARRLLKNRIRGRIKRAVRAAIKAAVSGA